jgi:hypothetical protein
MEPDRAQAVAARLLACRALSRLTPLEKEEQVLLLLQSHPQELAGLLAEDTGLAGVPWEQARELFSGELRRQTDRELGPLLETLLMRDGVFPFAASLQSAPVSGERCRQEIGALLEAVLRKPRARAALGAPLAAAWRDLPGRYLPGCLQRGQYIHFELAKVERLRLGPEGTASFVRGVLLLRAGALLVDGFAGVPADSSADGGQAGGPAQLRAPEALRQLRSELKAVPQAVLRSAVLSHLPCHGNPLLPASARLAAVFAAASRAGLGRRLRGAVPPEQSWWAIARRNASFHGLDAAMLEELHGVAARNGW